LVIRRIQQIHSDTSVSSACYYTRHRALLDHRLTHGGSHISFTTPKKKKKIRTLAPHHRHSVPPPIFLHSTSRTCSS
jgi:hypothetical protein